MDNVEFFVSYSMYLGKLDTSYSIKQRVIVTLSLGSTRKLGNKV